MDKLSEIIKLPIRRSGQSIDDYLDLLVCTLRNMIELINQNTNTLHQLFIIGGGAGVVDHGGLTGLTDADHPATAIVNTPYPAGAIAATTVQAAINELADEKSSTSHVHAASVITNTPAGDIAATNVQAALNELDSEKSSTTHVHAASAITNTPAGNIAATNVQTALNELDTEKIPAPASPEQGDILYYNGSAWVLLHHGTDGQVLKTGGDAANPSWIDIPAQSFRLPEVAHTADAVLTNSDMGKNHSDLGAADATDIDFTLPESPTNGDVVMFTHRTQVATECWFNILTYNNLNRIVADATGALCDKIYIRRDTFVPGISITFVAGANGYWYVQSEAGNPIVWAKNTTPD